MLEASHQSAAICDKNVCDMVDEVKRDAEKYRLCSEHKNKKRAVVARMDQQCYMSWLSKLISPPWAGGLGVWQSCHVEVSVELH